MNKALIICLLMLPATIFSQEYQKVDLFIEAKNTSSEVIPFLRIKVTKADGSQPQYNVTGASGNTRFVVLTGKSYKVFVYDTVHVLSVDVSTKSKSYITKVITVLDIQEQPKVVHTQNDTVDQTQSLNSELLPGSVSFRVNLRDLSRIPVRNTDVRLFNKESKMVYLSRTDNSGSASFVVPGKRKYIVAVNDFENYDTVAVPRYSFGLTLVYVPTKVTETERNDTVFQEPVTDMHPTSDRAFVKMALVNHDKQPLPDEWVYFDQVETGKVYVSQTGANGILTMLLPKGYSYELSFTYERNVKRLTYPNDGTLFTSKFYRQYIGTKRVEEFYANAAKDGDFRIEFMEPKTKPKQMDVSVIERTELGFNLNFENEGQILSPAIEQEHLFVSSGFYSPNIYCVNAQTGESIWGIELAENGPSVLVIEDGIMLVNTESCTLYAIDIEKGTLAWSKWLGPSIYHSPTIANGMVYASYPNDLSMSPNRYVIAAFDLKTGDIKWQNRLKNEPIGAPVVANGQLFVTDTRGRIYSFNDTSGEFMSEANIAAVTPPVFFNNSLYVNANGNGAENVVMQKLDPATLKREKMMDLFTNSRSDYVGLSGSERMSLSKGRIIVKGNNGYVVSKNGVHSFSPLSGSVNWTYPVKSLENSANSMAIAGNYLITEVDTSSIGVIDINSGSLYKKFEVDSPSSEPIVSNGWIYLGTKSGKVQAINTHNKSITGWNQWGMYANHNPVLE